jgi:hypothetical protein
VSEIQRISWKEATDLNATEFFNTFIYAIEKQKHKEAVEKAAYEKVRMKHHR